MSHGDRIRAGRGFGPSHRKGLCRQWWPASHQPDRQLETAGDLARIFGADADPTEARRTFVIARRLHRRLRNPSFARSVAALVAIEGEAVNGWLVLAGEQA